MNFEQFVNLRLTSGFVLLSVRRSEEDLQDAIGRPAKARASIVGKRIEIVLAANQSDEELSVSIYHEVIECMVVAHEDPPAILCEWNEGDFERAAYEAFAAHGQATADSLILLLEELGF